MEHLTHYDKVVGGIMILIVALLVIYHMLRKDGGNSNAR